ncbi:MAG: hypothetical protein ACXWVO_06345 [Caulobacteraceae bacterium]
MTLIKKLALAGLGAGALYAVPAIANAQCCAPPPPPCCKPPSPPPPCCGGGHHVNIPSVNVNVGATVIVNANATAVGVAGANAGASAGAVAFGGGGSRVIFSPGMPNLIEHLNVVGCCVNRQSYAATRTKIRKVIIRAVCIDDRDVPHPASQTNPDRELSELFEGELFRCIAGTRMQITVSDFLSEASNGPSQTINCAKGEAIYRSATGEMSCKPQKPARDCNERSLLRRYGAGVKILTIITTETYTATREEESRTVTGFAMTVDGGVGGVVH